MGKPDSKGTSGVRSRAISRESAHEAQNAADAQRAADRNPNAHPHETRGSLMCLFIFLGNVSRQGSHRDPNVRIVRIIICC